MSGFLWIFIWSTAGFIWASPDIPWAIKIPSMYDAYIIVHYELLNYTIVPSISFNIPLFTSLHWGEPKKMASDSKMRPGKTETITRLSDQNNINWTWTQCNPQNLPSHQGWQTQEHTIYPCNKEDEGTPSISEWFEPDKLVKLNSNVVWVDLWYLKCCNWEVSTQWIKMELERQ